MRVFVAGASGVIGRRLVPLLVQAGHDVVGMVRTLDEVRRLEQPGVRGVAVDVYDRRRLAEVLAAERPEIVVHELSALPAELGPSGAAQFDANSRMRTEGTRNLVEASVDAGVRRVVAQSYAHVYKPQGGWVKSEDEPLNLGPDVPELRRRNVEAIQTLERTVLETPGLEGVALRYGTFYGLDTAYGPDGSIARLMRQRHYPIVGSGQGRTSFIDVDDAAAATLLALSGPTGIYNITDDEPAPMADWVPVYARLLGAPHPRRVPAWVVRVMGREHFIYRATEQRGASNEKAKRELGMTLRFPTWREGFEAALSQAVAA